MKRIGLFLLTLIPMTGAWADPTVSGDTLEAVCQDFEKQANAIINTAKNAVVDEKEITAAKNDVSQTMAGAGCDRASTQAGPQGSTTTGDNTEDGVGTVDDADAAAKKKVEKKQEAYDEAKKRENSIENKTLGAAGMAAMGAGGQMLAQGLAEKKADEAAETDMKAYLSTMYCTYAGGKNAKLNDTNIEMPGANVLTPLYSQYVKLAADLKERKTALGLKAGIESEEIIDIATTGLYENAAKGKTGGAYASLARAMMDSDSADAAEINAQKEKSKKLVTAGAITAGVGAVASIAGNMLINKDHYFNKEKCESGDSHAKATSKNSDDECIINKCDSGYVPSDDGKSCEETNGKTCTCTDANAEKCVQNKRGKCKIETCKKGYKNDGKKCVSNKGDTCATEDLPSNHDANKTYVYDENGECVEGGGQLNDSSTNACTSDQLPPFAAAGTWEAETSTCKITKCVDHYKETNNECWYAGGLFGNDDTKCSGSGCIAGVVERDKNYTCRYKDKSIPYAKLCVIKGEYLSANLCQDGYRLKSQDLGDSNIRNICESEKNHVPTQQGKKCTDAGGMWLAGKCDCKNAGNKKTECMRKNSGNLLTSDDVKINVPSIKDAASTMIGGGAPNLMSTGNSVFRLTGK